MSLPFYDITCSGCSYQARFSYGIWYEFDGGVEESCKPQLIQGWCDDCEKVLTIFTPLSKETAAKEISEWEEFREEFEDTSMLGTLLGIFTRRKQHIDRANQAIAAINQCLEYYQSAQYPDRCLTCGSTKVQRVDLTKGDHGPGKIGIMHSCGGQLIATMGGRFSFADRPKVLYSADGRIISDERVGRG